MVLDLSGIEAYGDGGIEVHGVVRRCSLVVIEELKLGLEKYLQGITRRTTTLVQTYYPFFCITRCMASSI